MANNSDKGPVEVLHALFDFASESDQDILDMSMEEVRGYLSAEGINPTIRAAEFQQRLEQIKGQQRRLRAATERAQAIQRIAAIPASIRKAGVNLRDEVTRKVNNLNNRNPSAALAYFRKIEGASEDDLAAMLHDLELLDTILEEGSE